MKPTHHIIGCGGVASYFLAPFLRTLKHMKHPALRGGPVVLHDGDVLETKNLQRQNFSEASVDVHKATALVESCPWYPSLTAITEYVDSGWRVEDGDIIIVVADNHTARRVALEAADAAARSIVLSAANSTIGAEAWWYESRTMKGTPFDPRVRYPEILTDATGSPVHAEGCQSEERLNDVPQTPIANFMAASHLLLLWNFVLFERPKLDPKLSLPFWPIQFSNTATQQQTTTHNAIATA